MKFLKSNLSELIRHVLFLVLICLLPASILLAEEVTENPETPTTTETENPDQPAEVHKGKEVTLEELKSRQKVKEKVLPTVGYITIRLSYGLYNFGSVYDNAASGEKRTYSFPYGYGMGGWEVAARLGKDPDGKLYMPDNGGFGYYRSNKGYFADVEFGGRFFCGPGNSGEKDDCLPPQFYQYEVEKPGQITTQATVPVGLLGNPLTATLLTTSEKQAATNDSVNTQLISETGTSSALATIVYFNNYFHFTPVNYLLNFGRNFRWLDSSIGTSLQVARYGDYGDPVKMQNINSDSTIANIDVALRTYIHIPFTKDRVRLRSHIFYPLYSRIARSLKDDDYNNEEYIYDHGIDIKPIEYIYISLGYEQRIWKLNQLSGDSKNLYRSGFQHTSRDSFFAYLQIAFDIPLSAK